MRVYPALAAMPDGEKISGAEPEVGVASKEDHPYVWPEGREWDRCVLCRLGEAAHTRRASELEAGTVRAGLRARVNGEVLKDRSLSRFTLELIDRHGSRSVRELVEDDRDPS